MTSWRTANNRRRKREARGTINDHRLWTWHADPMMRMFRYRDIIVCDDPNDNDPSRIIMVRKFRDAVKDELAKED